jgi:ABC-type sugar transport system ATPase subunit
MTSVQAPAAVDSPTTADAALDMRGIGMRFGDQWVLRNVDYAVHRGSVHGVVGHNGAGKSTLMKIALGGYRPVEGTVRVGGGELTFSQPAEARRLGVGMVLQEHSLISTLTGLDNIFLNAEPINRAHLLKRGEEVREAHELCDRLGIAPSVLRRQASHMSPVEQQMVEIAKAMRLAHNVLILDEPTAPLSNREISALFDVIRSAAATGVGIVLITHHLNEIFAVTDHVTCLRDGSVTLSTATADTNMDEIIEAMLGSRRARLERAATSSERAVDHVDRPKLSVRDLHVGTKLRGVSFDLLPGEILGVAGLVGSGRSTLLRTLFGDVRPSRGEITLDGKPFRPRSPSDAILKKVYLIPEDRGVHGLVLTESIAGNVALPVLRRLSSAGVLRMSNGARLAQQLGAKLDIRSRGPRQIVGELSGGNQQKVVLAKALAVDAEVLLLDEPTYGIDIGAAADLIGQVRALTDSSRAAVWVSSDLQELLKVADRVLLLADGEIRRIVDRGDPEFSEASLLRSMQRSQYEGGSQGGDA